MRRSWASLYAPFLVLALLQGMFIAVAPSRGGSGGNDLSAFAGPEGGGDELGSSGADLGTDSGLELSGSSGASGSGSGASGPGASGSASPSAGSGASSAGSGSAPGGGGDGGAPAGDTSHCADGLQFKVFAQANPPCAPRFSGDNGGETYQGVTAESVKVIFFSAEPNEQVDAILAQQGLAVPREDYEAYVTAGIEFVQKHYELYGRKIDAKFIVGNCPTTPPDYDACNAAAQDVVKEKPFLVIWNTPLYASVFDIWAKAGIVALGGWQFEDSFFTQRRPFRYDPWMNGTELGGHLAEYYCKKMSGQKATHSGAIIHPRVGQRGQVDRKLGIVTPEIEANVLAAKRVAGAVKGCGGGDVPIFTYESDIERATEQTQAVVSGLIDSGVTSVACMCDPIAPAFLTAGMTANGYFPEFLIAGTQFIDSDLVGRLYDRQQMAHAFGLSLVPSPVSLDDADPTRMWRAMGREGIPCGKSNCGTTQPYITSLGLGLQSAGPNLNPLTWERGLLSTPAWGGWQNGGLPEVGLWAFGRDDYTWLSDMREVYWDPDATSKVDGERGAYVDLNGGRRYRLDEWPGGFTQGIPVR